MREPKASNGSSLVMALFIIVLMSVLLLALGRQLISSSTSVSIEVQGNRAFNAAQSGLQLALTQLFPLNTTESCAAVAVSFSFNQPGLQSCTATLSCSQVTNPDVPTRPLYQLTSTGSCQAGDFNSSRVVVMEAY
ncbi:type II secretory pathway component [Rheinheimera riviphila]|uniref:Type II secretory pathway component n=1 Tax=Rheinheimera riviphila TaxID=1834037 RepID=A0A437QER6_9GAMM|nr:type II secretory pathway component [Rheinheimera riviphila]RVU33068.1 type II secretory pathway component [Rheinheimera riviphila]